MTNETLFERAREVAPGGVNSGTRGLAPVKVWQEADGAYLQDAEGNRYLDDRAPWRAIREDRDDAARTLVTILGIIAGLKTLLAPYLPFSSQRLHEMLGLEGGVQDGGWTAVGPAPGAPLPQPQALFAKLDEEQVLAREMANLGAGAESETMA